jgi:AcrR family transcriptional regulator
MEIEKDLQEGAMAKNVKDKRLREKSTEARRRLIVETAAECFIDKGFHQTSIRDIASRAGISLGNLYNHFSSKADLIAEIAALEADETIAIEAGLAGTGDPVAILDRFVKDFFAYVSKPENTVLAAEILAEAVRNPAIGDGFARNRQALVGALENVLAKGVESRQFESDMDISEAAHLIIDLVEGAAMRLAFSTKKSRLPAVATLKAMIRRSLGDR